MKEGAPVPQPDRSIGTHRVFVRPHEATMYVDPFGQPVIVRNLGEHSLRFTAIQSLPKKAAPARPWT
jgi:hypothetical protein